MALIKGKQLANSAITAAKIADETITPAKLGITGVVWSFVNASTFSVPAPSVDASAATKAYVDGAVAASASASAAGLVVKNSVDFATVSGDMGGFSYSAGVITQDDPTVPSTWQVDQSTPVSGDRILVKNMSNAAHNGVYTITTVGNGTDTAWELTRAADFDTAADMLRNSFFFVAEGGVNADTGWVLTTDGDITVGTTELSFSRFSSISVSAGNGISVSESGTVNTVSINVANEGSVGFSSGALVAAKVISERDNALAVSSGAGSTGIALTSDPVPDSEVSLFVNGVKVVVGNNTTTSAAFFTADSGANAIAIGAAAAGDVLYWNVTAAGFALDTDDVLELVYTAQV
jgi:hypothetical protein